MNNLKLITFYYTSVGPGNMIIHNHEAFLLIIEL